MEEKLKEALQKIEELLLKIKQLEKQLKAAEYSCTRLRCLNPCCSG